MRIRTLVVVLGVLLSMLALSAAAQAHGGFYFSFGWGGPAYGHYHHRYPLVYRPYVWAPRYVVSPLAGYYSAPPRYKVYRYPATVPRNGVVYRAYTPRTYGRVYPR